MGGLGLLGEKDPAGPLKPDGEKTEAATGTHHDELCGRLIARDALRIRK